MSLVPATIISPTAASLNAKVTANAGAATYVVQYGPTTRYGSQAGPFAVTGVVATPVSTDLHNLKPLTTYHYRIVVTAPGGTATSTDATFKLVPPAIAKLTLSPRRTAAGAKLTLTYTDSEAARTVIELLSCSHGHAHCRILRKLVRIDAAGANTFTVSTRSARGKPAAGSYVLELVPGVGKVLGRPVRVGFRVS